MTFSFFLLFFFLFISPSFSSFIAPITKHHLQTPPFYTLQLYLKTPLQPTHLLLHINAPFTAIDCTQNYNSTTSRPVPCNSSLCRSLQSNKLNTSSTCENIATTIGINKVHDSCIISPHNSFALIDSLGLHTTNGYNQGQVNLFPEFILTCSSEASKLLHSSQKEIAGLAGFGFSKYSLPAQISTTSSVFAICLSGSPSAPGVTFFNFAKPYYFLPGIDVSEHLNYTPIITNENSKIANSNSFEDAYFIGVKSININEKPIITINETFVTKISTTDPYTVLERSIFTVLIKTFTNESIKMKLEPTDKPVKPFNVCYEADEVAETYLGPNIPTIDLVMENDVIWSVFGKNSMVRIVEEGLDIWCLAIVDGGVGSTPSIVIGGHQLEDNLLQFDLGTKRLGFSSSLLQYKTMCANFNFSTINLI